MRRLFPLTGAAALVHAAFRQAGAAEADRVPIRGSDANHQRKGEEQ